MKKFPSSAAVLLITFFRLRSAPLSSIGIYGQLNYTFVGRYRVGASNYGTVERERDIAIAIGVQFDEL